MEINVCVLLIVALILITLSMLFSASESAFLSLNKLRVRFLRDQKHKKAEKVGRLLDKKEELLNTLLIANNLVNIMLSAILTTAALEIFGSKGVGIATGIVTVLLLLFGEITPKTIATKHPERIAFGISGFISFISIVLKPFALFFTFISRSVLRIFGVDTREKKVSFTEDEIKTLIDVGSEEGILEAGENTMMNRVFKFTDLSATEIMIPRRDIIPVTTEMKFEEIITLSENSHLSRFPVVKEKDNLDTIIGFLYVKDMLNYAENPSSFSVIKAMRKPLFVPGTTTTSNIQKILTENHQSIAVVIDEYSGTDGILTSEDIAREIFGSTFKKTPAEALKSDLKNADFKNIFDALTGNEEIDGGERLSDLEEKLHIKLESSINETIAGLILERLGRMANLGDFIVENGIRFTVRELNGLRISKVYMEQDFSKSESSVLSENLSAESVELEENC